MPTPPIPEAVARATVAMIEQCLREGFGPPHVKSPKGSATEEAGRRLVEAGILGARGSITSRLRTSARLGFEPDWSIYQAPKPRFRVKAGVEKAPPQPVVMTPEQVRSDVMRALRKQPLSIEDIASQVGLDGATADEVIHSLRDAGVSLHQSGGRWHVTAPQSSHIAGPRFEFVSRPDNTFSFGVTSDNHIGSKYARVDVLSDLYDRFERAGVQAVLNAGNWIDGEASFNRHDLLVHGMDAQLRLLAQQYPRRPGIKTYAVAGDDHEGWYCFEPGVEILTKSRGWVEFADLSGDELVATKTADGVFEWQKPTRVIRKHHDGEMVRLRHRSFDIAVTPQHRFEVRRKASMHAEPELVVMTAADIVAAFKPRCFGIPRTADRWDGHDPGVVTIPRVPNRYSTYPGRWTPGDLNAGHLAALCGWFATEGFTDGNRVVICQDINANPENCERIAALFREMGASPRTSGSDIYVSSPDLAVWMREHCGEGASAKRLPEWVTELPRAQLAEVFDAMIRGDGHDRGAGSGWKFYSASPVLLAQMAEVCQKLGLATSSAPGNNCVNLHVSEQHQTAYLFEKPTIEHYVGPVYCVAVPNERIFVRQAGKTLWSMNSQREGVDIGRYAQRVMEDAGRDDWVDVGYMEAHFVLRNANTGASAVMALVHPGGGSAYAISYSIQKIIEVLDGGEKPAVGVYGHYHKLWAGNIRNVWCLQSGCTQDATPFMRKKKLAAHVGGAIMDLEQDPDTGAIIGFTPKMLRYFVRGYYENRWSHHGPVNLPERAA